MKFDHPWGSSFPTSQDQLPEACRQTFAPPKNLIRDHKHGDNLVANHCQCIPEVLLHSDQRKVQWSNGWAFDGFLEVWVTRDVDGVGHTTQCLVRLIWFINILKGSIIDTTCVSKVTTTSGSQPHVHYKQAKLASSANIQLSPTASPPPCCGHIVGHEPKKEWIMEVYDWWMLWDWLPTYNTSEPLRTRDPLSVRVFFSSVAEEEANVCFSLWGNSSQEIVSPIPLASNSPNI